VRANEDGRGVLNQQEDQDCEGLRPGVADLALEEGSFDNVVVDLLLLQRDAPVEVDHDVDQKADVHHITVT